MSTSRISARPGMPARVRRRTTPSGSACAGCRIGADDQKYKIDLWALAAEFARRIPDWEIRASLKLVRATEIGDA